MNPEMRPLTDNELLLEQTTALPDKEVASVLDLNADLDLGIDAAAPIDLAVAANANVAAPIDAAASANILSVGSDAQALADQGVIIDQGIAADATADSAQDSIIDQGDRGRRQRRAGRRPGRNRAPDGTTAGTAGAPPTSVRCRFDPAAALDGNLLNVNVDLAPTPTSPRPINGAVAANANVAAPIDAAVGANIGSIDSHAFAVAAAGRHHHPGHRRRRHASADQQSDLEAVST